MQKLIEGDRVAGVSLHLYRVPVLQLLLSLLFYLGKYNTSLTREFKMKSEGDESV